MGGVPSSQSSSVLTVVRLIECSLHIFSNAESRSTADDYSTNYLHDV